MEIKKEVEELKQYFWVIVLVLLVLCLRLPSLFEPLTYGDEGVYLTLGLAVRKGLILYKEIHDNKPPLLYLLAALAGNIFNFRLILFLWSLGTIYIFHQLARLLSPKNEKVIITSTIAFGILTSLRTFEGNIANAENFMIGTTIGGFYLYLKAKKWWQYLLAGLLFSFSTLFKMPALFDFVALIFFILLTLNKKKLRLTINYSLLTILGFITPILASVIYYWSKGALSFYLKAAFLQNIGYLSTWTPHKTKAFTLPIPLILRGSLVLGLVVTLILFRKKVSKLLMLILLWFSFSLFAALLSARPYPHYLLQALPAFSLSIGLIFYRSKEKIIPKILSIVLVVAFLIFKFWYYTNLPYYFNFYSYLLRFRNQDRYLNFFGSQTKPIYQAATYIKTHTQKQEKIFVWGDQPAIYALSGCLPVGRFTVAYHIKDFGSQQETIKALTNNPPRYLILLIETKNSFSDLNLLIHKKYLLKEQFGQIQIFHKIYP